MIHIGGRTYELIHENRNGWNFEAFRERFSEVLERYDYVIGDWGYNQLRLKGFFRDNHPKVTRDSAISSMVDYINEYCNFGCAYFVLEKQPGTSRSGEDGELNDELEGEDFALAEGALDAYVSASRAVAAAAQSSEAPSHEHQQVKFMPRAERDLRREQQRNSNRKDSAKDAEKEGGREGRKPFGKERGDNGGRSGRNERQERGGERQERNERGGDRNQERGERGGDRNQERGERQDRNDRGERNGERGGNRSERSERRNKRQHFNNNKAPVAAASEQSNHQPRDRGDRGGKEHKEQREQRDHSPKQS